MIVLLADMLCCDSPLCPDQIGRNPGLQAIWEDEKQRRRESNQASQIETPESQGEEGPQRKLLTSSLNTFDIFPTLAALNTVAHSSFF